MSYDLSKPTLGQKTSLWQAAKKLWPLIVEEKKIMLLALAAVMIVIVILMLLSALYVYVHNYIIISNHHLIKVQQSGLFARQTAELGLGNIEDVKGGRAGVLGTLLDFGDIEIQTAGASENFIFRTVHHPQLIADRLLQYKEEFRHRHPKE